MTALDLHLESAERQLMALAEKVADMRRGPSNARLGNLAHDGCMDAMSLSSTFAMIVELADLADTDPPNKPRLALVA